MLSETVRDWIAKAEADFATATRERSAKDCPNHDAVCFHSQQCIEKLLKAMLIRCGSTPPKTHDLAHLDSLLVGPCPDWSWPVEELRFVSRAAVAFRYPGESATVEEAAEVHELASRMRKKLLALLEEAEEK